MECLTFGGIMSKFRFTVLVIAASVSMAACAKKAPEPPKDPLGTESQKFSYSLGTNIGKQFQPAKTEIDIKALASGIEDAMNGVDPKIDEKTRNEVLQAVSMRIQQRMVEEQQKATEKNKTDGEKFLADNKAKPNIKTTASGLQYEVVTEGTGATPKTTDTVKVHYKGTLIDGTTFDSSYDRGEPITFAVTGVIAGWTEGLQLMKVGGKYKLYVPSDLAYGPRGAGEKIGPNSTLIFEIELLGIEKTK
jgi:FKBP-type peptidyl-prolyl cis-trans isomerase FkpA